MLVSVECFDLSELFQGWREMDRYSSLDELKKHMIDDVESTNFSVQEQMRVERSVLDKYRYLFDCLMMDSQLPRLERHAHIDWLHKSLSHLPTSYECLDASRPWLCYWVCHSLSLLQHTLSSAQCRSVVHLISLCQCVGGEHHEDPLDGGGGGFGGGPGQMAHLAATYAAVNALCTLGDEASLDIIDRPKLLCFLRRMRCADGSFCMHRGGEVDIRGVYCAVSVATLTNLWQQQQQQQQQQHSSFTDSHHLDDRSLFEGTAEWIVSCQTYEGGFSGCPGLEAHGGYTFCGLASLLLLGRQTLCHLESLTRWVTCRQMVFEGGFSGRTNKLVDSCYSFWQGASAPLIALVLNSSATCSPPVGDDELCDWPHVEQDSGGDVMFDMRALQYYLLTCCQNAAGGFVDKPGKARDYYHTCYALSGLSLAQNCLVHGVHHASCVVGDCENKLPAIHPLYNLRLDLAAAAHQYFRCRPLQRHLATESETLVADTTHRQI